MYVAYNRFYPPDLAHYESRNASPDRSHNETWDSLVITGIIGLLAYQFLFISVFIYGLRWVGLMPTDRERNIFIWGWLIGGLAFLSAAWWQVHRRSFSIAWHVLTATSETRLSRADGS
jgi:O-antigen ligase